MTRLDTCVIIGAVITLMEAGIKKREDRTAGRSSLLRDEQIRLSHNQFAYMGQ